MTIDQILIQICSGFAGSILAGGLIALLSDYWFSESIKAIENKIMSTLAPLNTATTTIAIEIIKLSEIVDNIKKGLEERL